MGNANYTSPVRCIPNNGENNYAALLQDMIRCENHHLPLDTRKVRCNVEETSPGNLPKTVPCLCSGKGIAPTDKKLCAALNQYNQSGLSPLHLACEIGHSDLVHILLHFGALPNLMSLINHGYTCPLVVAASNGHIECVRLLLHFGANVNQTDGWGNSALYKAACYNFSDCVEVLLEHGAEVNKVNKWGSLPLQYASLQGYHRVVSLLLKNGADVQMWGEDKELQAVTAAVTRGHPTCLKMLLEAGAPVNIRSDTFCFTPLEALVYYGCEHLDCLQLLLDHGAVVTSSCINLLHQHDDITSIVRYKTKFLETILLALPSAKIRRWALVTVFSKLTQTAQTSAVKRILLLILNLGLHLSKELLSDILGQSDCHLSCTEVHQMNNYLSTPKSLMELCRLKIRENLIAPVQKNVDRLYLPKVLAKYVKLA